MNIDQRQQKAINDLRRNKVGLRYGTVVADPDGAGRLCVNLGRSDEILVDVRSVGGASVAVGDRVPVLIRDNDALVLGGVGDGSGGGGGGPFQPLDADLTALAGMPTGLASSIVGMGPTAQDFLGADSPAAARAVVRDTSYTPPITVYGHSINYTGSSDNTRGIAHRLGTIMSTDIQMMAIGGSILSANLGAAPGFGGGGWDFVYRRTSGIPGTVSTAGIGAVRRGPTSVFTGVNDIGTMQQTTGASSGSMTVANFQVFQHSLRAVISRFRAANLWEEDDGITKSTAGKYKRTSGSAVITDIGSFAGITPGQWITGTGIPAATKVLSVDTENFQLTMTANASSGSATDTALTFSTVAYDTAYTRSGSTPSDTAVLNGSNGYYGTTTTVNNKVSLAVPTRFNGGTATVAFLVDDSGHGAVWTIALDGTTVGTVDTRNQNAILTGPVPFWNTCVFRVTGMPPGAQTITATPTTIGGANVAYFDCWWIEADEPPPICVPLQYYALYAYNPLDIDVLNAATSAVVAEFDEDVFTVETGDLMVDDTGTPDPELFNDAIHPNDRGHALIAARIADGFASRPRAQVQQSRGAYNLPFLTRHPGDNVRNLLQSNVPNVTPLTIRGSNWASTQTADLLSIQNFDGSTGLLTVGPTGAVTSKGGASIGGADIGTGAGGGLIANPGLSNYVALGYKGSFVTGPGIVFGTGLDTNIYRESANLLATDDAMHIVGNLTVDGTITGTIGGGGTSPLDLTATSGSNTATGSGLGDKIALWQGSNTNAYGFGIQTASLVAYVGTGGVFVVRGANATGNRSSSTTVADIYGSTYHGDGVAINDGGSISGGTSTGTIIGTGTTQKLGFFNATPVAQQSSTTDLRTGLINLGFFASGGASPLNLNGGALTTSGLITGTGGVKTSGGVLDLSVNTTADATAGTGAGDKIGLHGSGYGIGVQTANLVLYTLPSGGIVTCKEADASGTKCDGTTYAPIYGSRHQSVAGTSTDFVPAGGTLFDHFADGGNTTTGKTDRYSDTVLASTLGANGDKLTMVYSGKTVAHASATREVWLHFAGTDIFDTGTFTTASANNWTIRAEIIRVSGTVIRYVVSWSRGAAGAASSQLATQGELTGLTLSNNNTLKLSLQSSNATDDVVAQTGLVRWESAA